MIKAETVKRGQNYIGRCAVYDDGRRLYSFETEIRRLSRGDALADARRAAHDLIIQNCRDEWRDAIAEFEMEEARRGEQHVSSMQPQELS